MKHHRVVNQMIFYPLHYVCRSTGFKAALRLVNWRCEGCDRARAIFEVALVLKLNYYLLLDTLLYAASSSPDIMIECYFMRNMRKILTRLVYLHVLVINNYNLIYL